MHKLRPFGKDARFHHAGIAVSSISELIKNAKKARDTLQRVSVFLVTVGGLKVELVEPISEGSPVTNMLKKGQSLYHLCFQVKDIRQAMETARGSGFHCIAKPAPAKAFKNKRIAWLFSKNYGLVELLEK